MNYFLDIYAEKLKEVVDIPLEDIISMIEGDAKQGDLAFPCFKLARTFRKAPNMIAQDIVKNLSGYEDSFAKIVAVGPYVNAFISHKALVSYFKEQFTDNKILQPHPRLNENITIDFSSPNIAKPIAFHHIRSTVIGNSISNLFEFVGYDLKRINYLGDWGTQFGKLTVAFNKWGDQAKLEEMGIKHLLEIYIKFHNEAKDDPTLDEEARLWFKRSEDGDEVALGLWRKFRDISIKEFNRIYKILNIKFTHMEGESRYKDILDKTVEIVKSKVKTEISQGALIVPFEEKDDMPPMLLQKMDGATLYATRDIAAAMDRFERFNFARNLYVVGSQQQLHFKQLEKVLTMMGYDWATRNKHIGFGMVKGMSTRKGNIVFLEDVLNEAISLSKVKILEKGRVPEAEIDEVARRVGVGAIIFGDLKNSRINDFEFNWEELLNFSGYTGPYVQYSYTRIQSILRKSEIKEFEDADLTLLVEKVEIEMIKSLLSFPKVIDRAVKTDELYHLAKFTYSLSKLMASFHKSVNVLKSEIELQKSRLYLINKTGEAIKTALAILGVETVDNM